jgi:hypothetical protein
MASDHLADAPLQDYPNRSVWMTWAISYHTIRKKNEATANFPAIEEYHITDTSRNWAA